MPEPAAAPQFKRLFEPLQIGNFWVRNRIVNTTHGTAMGDARDLPYLQARARGGVGLMGLSASPGIYDFNVSPGKRSETPDWDGRGPDPTTPDGIAHYDNQVIPRLKKRSEIIHAEGAKCFGQVFSLGAAPHRQNIHPAIAPSSVPDPYDSLTPHPLTEEEIEQLIVAYSQAIRRVRAGGCDAAEIHGAHGYLVTQFFSPYFNRRTDAWGGSRENRVRFALEIIKAARKLVGAEFPIGIRVGLDGDGTRQGLTIEELAQIGKLLSPHVAYISVSGGTYSGLGDGFEMAYVSPWYGKPGFNVPSAAAIKKQVTVPVFVTGRIAEPALAESILAEGSADMIGMVRALIADPDLPKKAREGRPDDIRMCLGMSECHYIGPHRTPMTCAINSAAGRETEMIITPAAVKKTVLVIGAGPAGMEAARVSALRGHKVYLCDRERALGGTVRILAKDPNRNSLNDMTVFFQRELRRAKVELLLGSEVTADVVLEMAPDVVIVATGSLPRIPEGVPGVPGPHVVTGIQALRGEAKIGKRALVVGGLDNHISGPTIAEFLADQGKEVEFITEHLDLSHGAEDGTRYPLYHRLMTKNVLVSPVHKLVRVDGEQATVMQSFTRRERVLEDVTVVLACGSVPDDRLAHALRGKVKELYLVGDSLAPRRIMHATLEGARAAQGI